MQRWEYLSVTVFLGGDPKAWRPRNVNGEELQDWEKGPSIFSYLNKLGDEGWELVSEHLDPMLRWTNWEYLPLVADANWKKYKSAEGKTYKGMSGYMEYIDEIGQHGWELVTMAVSTKGGFAGEWLLLFKRSIEDKALRLRFKRPKT